MESIDIKEPAILIRLNKTFEPKMDRNVLFDYTRGRWKVKTERAKKAKYGIAVYKGIIQEVYEIEKWHKAGTTESSRKPNDRPDLNSTKSLEGRYEFTGKLASEEIRKKYNQKSVKHYFVKGNANPINYVNV
ncbi:hypothetical protein [Flavobacterium sp.]|uniref:hypothetical protein n=1 Tax=Flavobacterium sp. TaxID=239 RepID=UPI002629E60A|nr:hypothetical protein [Flavobacterium sp.]